MSKHDTEGFLRFKARRAAATTEDQDYRDFVSAMSGEQAELRAGVASHAVAGGEDVAAGTSDATIYQGYLDQLSGEAGRRRAEEMVKREKIEREAETVRHARMVGGGLSSSHEHLRSRIPGAGKPHEGA